MPGEASYINSAYRAMVVIPPTDGSKPIYGKEWKITSSSNQKLVGKMVIVLRTGEVMDSCDALVGKKLIKFGYKFLEIYGTNYLWKKRVHQPPKIDTWEEKMGGEAYRYRFSQQGAVQLQAFSPIAGEFLHRDDRGFFLQLRPHPTDQQKLLIQHPDDRRYFDCLGLKRKKIHIPQVEGTSSSTVRLAIKQMRVTS